MESWPTSSIESWNPLSSRDDMESTELTLSSCAEIDVPLDLRRVSHRFPPVA